MEIVNLDPSHAVPLDRPGCRGMTTRPVVNDSTLAAAGFLFEPHATSDQYSASFPQMLVVTSGRGWVSVGAEAEPVRAGQAVPLPPDVLHRFWTEAESLEALALAWSFTQVRSLVVVRDGTELAHRAAEWFVRHAREAIQARGRFLVALSGGSTPRGLYEQLASAEFRDRVDWRRISFFWGDERPAPPDDPQSNHKLAYDALLSKIPTPPEQVYRMEGERAPEEAARRYEAKLRGVFGAEPFPRFDLVLLGLGENGHTASLFPRTQMLHEKDKWVAAEHIDEIGSWRISLTTPAINHAAHVMFLVGGAGKAQVFFEVWNGARAPADLPARLIAPVQGDLMWLLDYAAAGEVPHVE